MMLAYPLLNEPITFTENTVNVLTLEHPQELRKAIFELQQQIAGGEGGFVLSEKFQPIELSKYAALVTDPFELVLDSKKLTGKINQLASQAGENYVEEFQQIAEEINGLAVQIGMNLDFEAAFQPLERIETLVDMMKFRVDKEDLSFPEQILVYMKLYRRFFGIRLFIFYNLKACLDEGELKLLYRSICYEKLAVLLLEDVQRGQALPEEKTVIIDKDLCVF
jgi:CRISPR-associated protein Csn2